MSIPESFGFVFRNGVVQETDPATAMESSSGFSWIQLSFSDHGLRETAIEKLQIPPEAQDALWADITRPRLNEITEGLIINLRGVNLNPGKDPDDMVSLRLWVTERCILGITMQNFMAVSDLYAEFSRGRAAESTLDIVLTLIKRVISRKQEVMENLEELLDEFEDEALEGYRDDLPVSLASVRRQSIRLKRFFAPQREVFRSLLETSWPLNQQQRRNLMDYIERATRFLEDLDAARERGAVVQDQIAAQQNARMNRTMLALSVVAAIFLPLSFITGLLGINVGGIPGAGSARAFLGVCGILAVIGLLEIWWVRKSRWMS